MNLLRTFFFIVLLGVIIFFILRWLKLKRSLNQEQEGSPEPVPGSPRWLFPFFNPFAKKRIRKLHRQHSHKVHEQHLAEIFTKFGPKPKARVITPTNFHRLKAMVHTHEKKHQNQLGFQNLDHLVQKLDQWEKNKPLSSKEKAAVITELRKIAKKA